MTAGRVSRLALSLLLLLSLSAAAVAQTQSLPANLDAYVQRTMKEFEIPGLALAVVKDGRVVYAKGYGTRKLSDPAKVDEHTLFGIASNTKAFNAATVAILVDEGKLSWDDRVVKHLPSFRVDDPYVTNELMVRDLLSHRTGLGLGQGDLMYWPNSNFTRQEVVDHARYLKPLTSLRSKYAYNNLTFIVASELVANVAGQPWTEFVKQRIFVPLGMSDTVISTNGFKPGMNYAVPHSKGWRLAGKLVPVEDTRDDTWAGASGVRTSANDIAKWMITQLNGGKSAEGKQIFSEKQQRQMWTMHIPVPTSDPSPLLAATKPQFSGYGLGWALRDYRGHKVVSHGGGLTGMVSAVQLMPDQKLGIAVFSNQEESGALSAIVYRIFDHYLGLPETDWVNAYRTTRSDFINRSNAREQQGIDSRAKDSHPSMPLANYVGSYHDNWYGDVSIASENGKLVLRFSRTPSAVADLEHFQYDTFHAIFRDNTVPDAYITFWLDTNGKIDQMKMVPTNDLADFSYDYQDMLFKPANSAE